MAKAMTAASVIMGTENQGGIIGKTLGGHIWEDLSGEPHGAVRVSRNGGCNVYPAERRSDGAYQLEGRNWCAIFDETTQHVIDLGPRQWAAYGGVNGNVPEFIDELITDLRAQAYGPGKGKTMIAKMTLNQAFYSKDEPDVISGTGSFSYLEDMLPSDTFAVGIKNGHTIALYSNDVAACEAINQELDAAGSSYGWIPCEELDWETEDEILVGDKS